MKIHNLFGNADIIRTLKSRRLQWAGHVVLIGDGKRTHKNLLAKPESMRPPRRPKIK